VVLTFIKWHMLCWLKASPNASANLAVASGPALADAGKFSAIRVMAMLFASSLRRYLRSVARRDRGQQRVLRRRFRNSGSTKSAPDL
jgi:hypothetical protein